MKTTFSSADAHRLLEQHFGYTAFRPGQEDIVRSIAEGHDTIAVMPTGGGKSLCYQIPALLRGGTALVVSPLISLMQDQVRALGLARIPATFINSSLSYSEISARMQSAMNGAYSLLYIAPERFEQRSFLEQLRRVSISFLAIDEAHCISEWGHDFRPAYTKLAEANDTIGRLPVIALTATATPDVRRDIAKQMHLRNPAIFMYGFDRPNLRYEVERTDKKFERIGDILQMHSIQAGGGSHIIYAGSRRRVEECTQNLRSMRIPAQPYHGGMADGARTMVQEEFLRGQQTVIVATNAFGMGIDKRDVRTVFHIDLPLTIEAYYQEAGRAGRDGEESRCILLSGKADIRLPTFFLGTTYPQADTIKTVYTGLCDMQGIPVGQKAHQPILTDETRLGNRLHLPASTVSAALGVLERSGILKRLQESGSAQFQFLAEQERLREYFNNTSPRNKRVLSALLRSVGGDAFSVPVPIHLQSITQKHDVSMSDLEEALRAMSYAHLIRFQADGSAGGIALLTERMEFERLPVDWEHFYKRKDNAEQKLSAMMNYVRATTCKRNYILQYFGDDTTSHTACSKCSSCRTAAHRAITPHTNREVYLRRIVGETIGHVAGQYGRTMVCDIIRGTQRKQEGSHRSLTPHQFQHFAAGKEFSKDEVLLCVDELIGEGCAHLSAGKYPTITLTPLGQKIFGNPTPLISYNTAQYTARQERQNTTRVSLPKVSATNTPRCLYPDVFSACVRVRRTLADQSRIPEQDLIDDIALCAMVNALPTTKAELRKYVPQGGTVFLSRYAEDFLAILRSASISHKASTAEAELSETLRTTLCAVREGMDMEMICRTRKLKESTICNHICTLIERGISLPYKRFVSEEFLDAVRVELLHNPSALMRDLHSLFVERENLRGKDSFTALRIAMTLVRKQS
jgi:ATP-dependent DNA helicase RecQ